MRPIKNALLLLLVLASAATTVQAVEYGDLAPRSSLAYARVRNASEAARRLGGEDWPAMIDRIMLTLRKRDREEAAPALAEIKRFSDHVGAIEFAIVDIMARDPNVQLVIAAHLGESAPKEFSAELQAWFKKEFRIRGAEDEKEGEKEGEKDKDGGGKVGATEFQVETFRMTLRPGLLLVTLGGNARAHCDDALRGETAESLSKVDRFKKWSNSATNDAELWMDMRALRNALDKMGEDGRMDRELQVFLDTVEWQKWDVLTASLALPGKTGGSLILNADLTFNPGLDSLGALIRPAGASRMVRTLPSETLGFVCVQLGNDADRTWNDLLRFIHDAEMRDRTSRTQRQLDNARDRLERYEDELRVLNGEKPKRTPRRGYDDYDNSGPRPRAVPAGNGPGGEDGEESPETPAQAKKRAQQNIDRAKAEVARVEQQMKDAKPRPFTADRTTRPGRDEEKADRDSGRDNPPSRRTSAEQLCDTVDDFLKTIGTDRAEAAQTIGNEAIAGVLGLPDPGSRAINDMMEHLWFASIELREGHEAVKQKMLDWMLAKRLPEGATEKEIEQAKKRAEQMLFKNVDGGEILREAGPFSEFCIYIGDNFAGIAGCEEVALRVLKAAAGDRPFPAGLVPGGLAGSKVGYIDLGEFLARLEDEEAARDREGQRFVQPMFEVRKLLKNGLRLSVSTNESAGRITFTATTAGESNLRGLFERIAREAETARAYDHDQEALNELGQGINRWMSKNQQALAAMSETDRRKALAAVAPETLVDDTHFTPADGLRSAFDPAMAARFKTMLETGERVIGGEKGAEDLTESGFEWFGMPSTWEFKRRHEGERRGDEEDEYESTWGPVRGAWLLAASRGAWAREGRMALLLTGRSTRVVWLEEAQYLQLKVANAGGTRLAKFAEPKVALPRWKAQVRMRRDRYLVQNLRDLTRRAADAAREEGREFEISFDGSNGRDTVQKLREALGVKDGDWFPADDVSKFEIEAKGDKLRVRYKLGDHWMEIDNEGKTKTSWDSE